MNHSIAILVSKYQKGHWLLRTDLQNGSVSMVPATLLRDGGVQALMGYEAVVAFTDMFFHDDEREALRALLKGFGGPIGLVDNRDDPIVLKLALSPGVVYFKREYRRQPEGVLKSTGYWVSWAHMARKLGVGALLPPHRELALRNDGRILPLPLTISNSIQSDVETLLRSERMYTVSMIANMNLPRGLRDYIASGMSSRERLRLSRLLAAIPGAYIHLYNYDKPRLGYRLPPSAYASVIASSISSVAPKGSGGDTYRYYEIPALGAVLLSRRPSVVIPNDFLDKREALFFKGYHHLISMIEELSSDRRMAASIARAGHEKYQRYHTPARRLQYLLSHLNG